MSFLSNLFDSETTSMDSSGAMRTQNNPGSISQLLSSISNIFKPQAQPAQAKPQTMGAGYDIASSPAPKLSSPMPQQQGFRLSVPSDQGTFNLPDDIAQEIGNVFEPSKQATAAAQVLHHPNQQTRTPQEILRLGENWNRGENPEMIRNKIDIPNNDGSIDRGLFRINSNTFSGMLQNPFWKQAMEKRGITSWDDMEDPQKNVNMAYLILARGNWDSKNSQMLSNPSWGQWYAAPQELR